jgi:uncharacterized protein
MPDSLTQAQLCFGTVTHARMRPVSHRFRYGVYFLQVPLSKIDALPRQFFSLDGWNLFSFHRKDHGPCDGSELEAWIRGLLRQYQITNVDGEIVLQAFPRVLGYVFNPISFWFCHDKQGAMRAVLCEVRNTFGERHNYLIANDDGAPITTDKWFEAKKVFHVSPFFDVAGDYRFRFEREGKINRACINYHDADGLLLATSVGGDAQPLNTRAMMRAFFAYPWMTFGVVARIHWQALRLWIKGAGYRPKPPPPAEPTTR